VLLHVGGVQGTETAWMIVLVCALIAGGVGVVYVGPTNWPWPRRAPPG
jgi:hypothetical protein